ncbi:MAG TPA: hypothetical protein PK014_11350 [Thermoanaerobaculia bacterium]|nr:hypothetical protein [Thermoanaerobaculia bacterium]HUM30748.1 hypothetical protein [Thermoanaerobaculia bacterium]HXK68963.1 hypothetical protein [Thermoanaerobaculia bacterium]
MHKKVPVVLRFRDGHIEKCMASPYLSHTAFTIQVLSEDYDVHRVAFKDLKAVFFVKNLDSEGHEPIDLTADHPGGPKAGKTVDVTFFDGESIRGKVLGSLKEGCGFFLLPANPEDNNDKIFVVRDALKELKEL